MLKKFATFFMAIILALAALPFGQQAEAATTYTFVKANYQEVKDQKGNVTDHTLKSVALQNSAGKTSNFTVSASTRYYINNTSTTIDGFKIGMSVNPTKGLKNLTELRGISNVESGTIGTNSKQILGSVTEIDPNGLYVKVKQDNGTTTTYIVNANTEFFKDKKYVDLTTLYVGDRVRLKFSSATTKIVSEVEIISTSATAIKDLYKADFQAVNVTKNTISVKNSHSLLNWRFGTTVTTVQKTYTFTSKTPIYVGNKKITKNQLKNYRNSELYFVTTKQFSKEVVNKIIVLQNNEFTFYQPLKSVNTAVNQIVLQNGRSMKYHEGSILVRNGRIIEENGLIAMNPATALVPTTAFVVSDGTTAAQYAQVVNITNDSLFAPNLSTHELYFGRINEAILDDYKVVLSDLERFNNVWKKVTSSAEYAFSNSTVATEYNGTYPYKVIPELDLDLYDSFTNWPNPYYGYFYVINGHVQAIHFVPNQARSSLTVTGRVQSINVASKEITVKDSSQWNNNGQWDFRYGSMKLNFEKAMIMRNGKVIQAGELNIEDNLIVLTNSSSQAYFIIVNE